MDHWIDKHNIPSFSNSNTFITITYWHCKQLLDEHIILHWSYLIVWAGIGACLIWVILLTGAIYLWNEKLNLQYLIPGAL